MKCCLLLTCKKLILFLQCLFRFQDDHKYYKMVTFEAKDINRYYVELDRAENHDALSDSYRTAAVSIVQN